MRRLTLSNGQVTTVDAQDFGLVNDGRNWSVCRHKDGREYVRRLEKTRPSNARKTQYMHRVILARKIGRPLRAHEVVDHRNGNTLDNRRRNLRLATTQQNICNKRKIVAKSGFKGVTVLDSGKAQAFCWIKGGPKYLGTFDTPEQAAAAYDRAAKARAGRFAATNKELRSCS